VDEAFILKVCALERYHMHMLYILKDLPYGNINNLLREVDIEDVALLSKLHTYGKPACWRKQSGF
jgi:hypothetical protein